MVRWAAGRILLAPAVTPELLASIATDVTSTLDFIERLDPFAAVLMLWAPWAEGCHLADPPSGRQATAEAIRARCTRNVRWVFPEGGINHGERLRRVMRKRGAEGPLWLYMDRWTPWQ